MNLDLSFFETKGNLKFENKESDKRYLSIQKNKELFENTLKMYKEYQEAIIKSEKLRSQINKNIKSGLEYSEILIKSIECISLLTGDNLFYIVNSEKIKERNKSKE